MREFLDGKLIGMQLRAKRFFSQLAEEEKGDTNFVSIILIMVIVIGIAGVFRKQLKDAVDAVMGQLTGFINSK